ncbi:chemotaxis protein CheW [Massilia violaceinigra]|uniref:Chemotaxis protein CheW n=1 Tax=Massilia violaceinigra TaxID=2045208 RepID=A0ABY3ZZL5_9BURK|nr:chemotaxis protein CheW [Massilia violaceinigra]UOD27917.1 chemotaxis protein CheW [Massilia violaceinigra]
MKVMVFHIGADRYALPLWAVARVVPAAALKAIPLAPAWVAGLLDLHGEPVPVIDLSSLAGVPPAQLWYDSRIILVDYPAGEGATRPLGLLAEHVVGVDSVDGAALRDAGVGGAPFLGQVAAAAAGMLQLVSLEQLLAPDVRALLFCNAGAAP